jgi:integrase
VEHLDSVVRAGDTSWKSAALIWSLLLKAFDDACRSKTLALRVRKDNPIAGVRGPDRGIAKAKSYLWPSEFLQLVACPAVPLVFRRAVCIAVYLYLRTAEQRAFTWDAVDMAHASALVHETENRTGSKKTTKGKKSRRVPIEPNLMPLLAGLPRGSDNLVTPLVDDRHLSRSLQKWLQVAGIGRAELSVAVKDKTRKRMTWHDLRATGITWAAVRGDAPQLIQHRAGHERFETTLTYIREAENLRAGFGEVFPSLPLEALGIFPQRPGELPNGAEKSGNIGEEPGSCSGAFAAISSSFRDGSGETPADGCDHVSAVYADSATIHPPSRAASALALMGHVKALLLAGDVFGALAVCEAVEGLLRAAGGGEVVRRVLQ